MRIGALFLVVFFGYASSSMAQNKLNPGVYSPSNNTACGISIDISKDQMTVAATMISYPSKCNQDGMVWLFAPKPTSPSTYTYSGGYFEAQLVIMDTNTFILQTPNRTTKFKFVASSDNLAPVEFRSTHVIRELDGPQTICNGTQYFRQVHPINFADRDSAKNFARAKVKSDVYNKCHQVYAAEICSKYSFVLTKFDFRPYVETSGYECGVPYTINAYQLTVVGKLFKPNNK